MTAAAPATGLPPLEIYAAVGEAERPLLTAAVRLLSECVAAAAGTDCRINLVFGDAVRSDFLRPDGPAVPEELRRRGLVPPTWVGYPGPLYQPGRKLVVLSLLADVLQPALVHRREQYALLPLPDWQRGWTADQRAWVADNFAEAPAVSPAAAAGHWHSVCAAALRAGATGVLMCTVFRGVPGPAPHRLYGTPETLRERIGRFNLLAAEVSHDTGACVVDLDRALAHLGGRALRTDYRLGGEAAAAAGADALVSVLFRAGLDDYFDPGVQARALEHFEARRATADWLALRNYRTLIREVVAGFRTLAGGPEGGTAEGAQRLSRFLRWGAERLEKLRPPGNFGQHRRLVAVLREIGAGQLDRARALAAGDASGRQRAEERVRAGGEQFEVVWQDFDDYWQRSAGRCG